LYRDFLDAFIIDSADEAQKPRIEALGIRAFVTNTIMRTLQDKVQLADAVLRLIEKL